MGGGIHRATLRLHTVRGEKGEKVPARQQRPQAGELQHGCTCELRNGDRQRMGGQGTRTDRMNARITKKTALRWRPDSRRCNALDADTGESA